MAGIHGSEGSLLPSTKDCMFEDLGHHEGGIQYPHLQQAALGSMGQGPGLGNGCGSCLSLASSIRVGLSGLLVSLLASTAGTDQ